MRMKLCKIYRVHKYAYVQQEHITQRKVVVPYSRESPVLFSVSNSCPSMDIWPKIVRVTRSSQRRTHIIPSTWETVPQWYPWTNRNACPIGQQNEIRTTLAQLFDEHHSRHRWKPSSCRSLCLGALWVGDGCKLFLHLYLCYHTTSAEMDWV